MIVDGHVLKGVDRWKDDLVLMGSGIQVLGTISETDSSISIVTSACIKPPGSDSLSLSTLASTLRS